MSAASLEGTVALVMGASRGIGKASALELGGLGATVYTAARSIDATATGLPGTLGETAEAITRSGGCGIAVQCDSSDDGQVGEVFDRIAREHDRLDILVNSVFPSPDIVSAFGPEWGGPPFWEASMDGWHPMFDIAVRGQYLACQRAVPLMLDRGGLIVNVSSPGSAVYLMGPLYGAAKGAWDRLTANMAHELREYPVAVLALWPGIVRTEFGDAAYRANPESIRQLLRETWGPFPDADHDIAAFDADGLLGITESPAFTGRAVAALAGDPNVGAKAGRAHGVAVLADEYGFTDTDGGTPDPWRLREAWAWPTLEPAGGELT